MCLIHVSSLVFPIISFEFLTVQVISFSSDIQSSLQCRWYLENKRSMSPSGSNAHLTVFFVDVDVKCSRDRRSLSGCITLFHVSLKNKQTIPWHQVGQIWKLRSPRPSNFVKLTEGHSEVSSRVGTGIWLNTLSPSWFISVQISWLLMMVWPIVGPIVQPMFH